MITMFQLADQLIHLHPPKSTSNSTSLFLARKASGCAWSGARRRGRTDQDLPKEAEVPAVLSVQRYPGLRHHSDQQEEVCLTAHHPVGGSRRRGSAGRGGHEERLADQDQQQEFRRLRGQSVREGRVDSTHQEVRQ